MKIRIKRFDKDIPLPKYHTGGAAAFDLYARETVEIQPQTVGHVPLNVAIECPEGHMWFLAARSSTHKKGLLPANGVGIIDSDFRGDEDEVKIPLLNFTDHAVTVMRGDRIAQGIFVKCEKAEWEEVGELGNKTRGGFGSTGHR